ncbi:hypothetical protein COLO4_36385 [Corchorus olitorius]|uniref:Uncharacterized protein n=1 Tax=Corchorus olitorius TaxID=93759 RepID=A0A1R3G984_9ROSI|nr:hypothetical protein COLO4_36385 [Corchorus olitorius]
MEVLHREKEKLAVVGGSGVAVHGGIEGGG